MMRDWTLSEEQAKKILNTEPIKLKESKFVSNLYLTEEKQIEIAKKILDSRKETIEKSTYNTVKPYSQEDYEIAKELGLNLDDWNDYQVFYKLGE